MFLKRQIKQQIEQELELHFLFHHLILATEVKRLAKEVEALDRNLTMNAKVQNLLNFSKSTHENYEVAQDHLVTLEKEALEAGFKDFSSTRLENLARQYVKDDVYYEQRIIMAIKLMFSLPNKLNAKSKNAAFKTIATHLAFPKNTALIEIEKTLRNNYKDISSTNKIDQNELIKVGLISSLVVAGLVSVVTFPLIGLGATASLSGAIATNLITTTSLALVSGVSAAGVAYLIKDRANDAKILAEFNNLTPDELAYMLAFNATLIQTMRKLGIDREASVIKSRLDLFVKLSNQLNVDYYLKQQNIDSNADKKKIIAKCDDILVNSL